VSSRSAFSSFACRAEALAKAGASSFSLFPFA
jgi:hypothetical protein